MKVFSLILLVTYLAAESRLRIEDCSVRISLQFGSEISCIKKNANITSLDNLTTDFDPQYRYLSILINFKNLSEIVEPLFDNFEISMLDLSHNQIETISARTFSRIVNLKILRLEFNRLTPESFYLLTFSSLANFNFRLHVNVNSIVEMAQTIPTQMGRITELYMSNNKLRQICDGAFLNLKTLRTIDLSVNELESLSAALFVNLPYLSSIKLNSNRIRSIGENAFKNLYQLEIIQLNHNDLSRLEYSIFKNLKSLRAIELDFNPVVYISSKAFASSLSSLGRLSMRGFQMANLDLSIFESLNNLVNLDLSLGGMKQISTVNVSLGKLGMFTNLDLSYLRLETFDFDDLPSKFTQLRGLYLSFNQIRLLNKSRLISESDLTNNVHVLRLDNNLIEMVEPGFFVAFKNLETLVMYRNLISELEPGVFDQLLALDSLDLSLNLLEAIPGRLFFNLTVLTFLSLASNRVKTIEYDAFIGLDSLTELDLSGNKIESIKSNYFSELPSLKKLNLSNNLIIEIETDAFRRTPHLKVIDLYWNDLESFELKSELYLDYVSLASNDVKLVKIHSSNISIKEISLSSNYIYSFESILNLAGYAHTIRLSDNELSQFVIAQSNVIHNITCKLEHLDLSHNRIRKFRVESDRFASIKIVDLAWNMMENLTVDDFRALIALTSLNLSNNRIKNIEEQFFLSFKFTLINLNDSLSDLQSTFNVGRSLVEIDLSNNVIARDLVDGNFSSLQRVRLQNTTYFDLNLDYENLIELDVSFNNLTFDLVVINQMLNLKSLILKSTGLVDFLDNVQINLPLLYTLDMSSNKIGYIPTGFFQNLPTLRRLDLSCNLIEYIDENLFDDLLRLMYLNLENNRLMTFTFPQDKVLLQVKLNSNKLEEFTRQLDAAPYNNLVYVDFSFNQLTDVDFTAFFTSGQTMLEKINLNNNQLGVIRAGTFGEMVQLKVVQLRSNQIEMIEEEALANLKVLERLDLADNRLTLESNSNLFDSQTLLNHLNLSSNRIERIQIKLFDRLFNLHELDLSNNRLKSIQPYLLKNLNQLGFIDISKNDNLLIKEHGLSGLNSVKDVWLSFDQLDHNQQNQQNIKNSLSLAQVRVVDDLIYFRSIYVNYVGSQVDCALVLDFIRLRLQLKLKTENDFSLFLNSCFSIKLNTSFIVND